MILSRTPLRIPLAAGGCDFPPWVAEHGATILTAGIDKHVYVAVSTMFDAGYLLKYSTIERCATIDSVRHPIIREALRLFKIPPRVEIVSMADIPAGTGLGSSGAFTVGLCKALAKFNGYDMSRDDAARCAAEIELEILGRPGGSQDHWACASGGISELSFKPSGRVYSSRVMVQDLEVLQDSLVLFFTGFSRDAGDILASQSTKGLGEIQSRGYEITRAIVEGRINDLGLLMHEHWLQKVRRSSQMTSPEINRLYWHGLNCGAIGGKLVGAGGGGFLLFVTEDRERLVSGMGVPEVGFGFDHEGVVLL